MLLNNKLCADAGTVNCPCYLAECGMCIVCRRLQAEAMASAKSQSVEACTAPPQCDCQWQGVCIYNEYLQNNKCINECIKGRSEERRTGAPGGRRESRLCKIQKIKWFEDDLAVLRIAVPRGMAERAALPGSFVFVKRSGDPEFFSIPLSVMRADYEESFIELAVKVQGPKSRALLGKTNVQTASAKSSIGDACGQVELRGIYRNGLLGSGRLMADGIKDVRSDEGEKLAGGPARAKRVLCLAKGVGLAPVANYIRWAGGRDRIDVIADLEKINREFAEYALEGCRMDSIRYGSLPLNLSWAEEEIYDAIIISASEYYQKNIYVPESKKVLSNNHTMCCGEGICGACLCEDGEGRLHHMCKCSKDSAGYTEKAEL